MHELLQTDTAQIIALGGGAWIQKTNRDLVQEYRYLSVWLDTPFEVCWARIETSGEDRPLGKTREQAEELFNSRRRIYQLSNVHVLVTGQEDFDEVISRIAVQIGAV